MDVVVFNVGGERIQGASHPYIILNHDEVEAWDVFTLALKIKELSEVLNSNSVNSIGRVMVTEFLTQLEAEIGALKNNR